MKESYTELKILFFCDGSIISKIFFLIYFSFSGLFNIKAFMFLSLTFQTVKGLCSLIKILRFSIKQNVKAVIFNHHITTYLLKDNSAISGIQFMILIKLIEILLCDFRITSFTKRFKYISSQF